MAKLTPVDHDPFAPTATTEPAPAPRLTAVDYDPFSQPAEPVYDWRAVEAQAAAQGGAPIYDLAATMGAGGPTAATDVRVAVTPDEALLQGQRVPAAPQLIEQRDAMGRLIDPTTGRAFPEVSAITAEQAYESLPSRTPAQLAGDLGAGFRGGARRALAALVDAPENIINAASLAMQNLLPFDTGLGYVDFEAPSQEASRLRQEAADIEGGRTAAAVMGGDALGDAEGFLDTLQVLASNPGIVADQGAAMAGNVYGAGAVPGSTAATLALQGLSAAGQNADQVRQELRDQGLSEEEIDRLVAGVFGVSTGVNTLVPAAVPGAAAVERIASGRVGQTVGSRAARVATPLIGETVGEVATEAPDQILQNLATGRPWDEGVGNVAALAALMGAGQGGPAGLIEGITGTDAMQGAPIPTGEIDVTPVDFNPFQQGAGEDAGQGASRAQPAAPAKRKAEPSAADTGPVDAAPNAGVQPPAQQPAAMQPREQNAQGKQEARQEGGEKGTVQAGQAQRAAEGNLPDVTDPLAPRVPPAPAPAPGETREQAVADWRAAKTPDEKAAAAARIAGFDAQSALPDAYRQPTGALANPEADQALTGLYETANRAKPTFDSSIQAIADEVGGEAITPPLKGRARTEEKIRDDYGGDPSRIKDLLRATIEVDDVGQATRALQSLRNQYEVVEEKNYLDPASTTPYAGGYRDAKLIVRTPEGSLAEVILLPPEMKEAKKEAHRYYAEMRSMDAAVMRNGGVRDAGQVARWRELSQLQAEIYGAAWEAITNRSNASLEIDSSAPGLASSEGGSGTGSAPAYDSSASPPSGMGTRATGEPSRSNSSEPSGGTAGNRASAITSPPAASVAPAASGVQQKEAAARRVVDGIRNAPPVTVHATVADLPADVRERAAGDEEAVFDPDTGEVHLIAENIGDPARAEWVATHEVAHAFLRSSAARQALDLDETLQRARQNPFIDQLASAIEAGRPERGVRAVEEAIAELATASRGDNFAVLEETYGIRVPESQRATLRGAIDRVLARVKAALDRLFGRDTFSDAEVFDLVSRAWAETAEDIQTAQTSEQAAELVASRRVTPAAKQTARMNYLTQLAANGFPLGSATQALVPGRFERLSEAADNLRTKMQDKMLPLRRAQEEALARRGVRGGNRPAISTASLDDAMNAYRMENLMHGRVKDRQEAAEQRWILPMQQQLRRLGLSLEQLEDYLLARHAPERNAHIATINDQLQDGGAGITTARAQAILAGTEEGPYSGKKLSKQDVSNLALVAQKVDAIRDASLQNMVDAGQITAQLASDLKKRWSYYVPLRGQPNLNDEFTGTGQGSGRGLQGRRRPFKRALGRGDDNLPENIVGELVGDLQRSIVDAEKARVVTAFMRFALANPIPELYTVEPVDLEWKYSESTGEAYLGVKSAAEDSDRTIVAMRDGKPVRIRFEDRALRDAMLNMGVNDMQGFVRIVGAVNRWRSAVLTRFNPAFTPINILRDLQFGLVAITAERGVVPAAKAVVHYLPALRAAYRDARRQRGDASKPNAQKNYDDWVREAAEAGMKTGLTQVDDVKDLQMRLSSAATGLMSLASQGKAWTATKEAIARTGGPILKLIEDVNDASENALRVAVYIEQRKSGMSIDKAAEYAKNVTINFNRKGQVGSVLNALYLFYNAAMQGTHAVQRVLRNPKVIAYLAGMGALQAWLATTMMDDDDDEDKDGVTSWDMVPDYVKRTSLVIPLSMFGGEKGSYFALPMPYGFNVFPYTGGRIAQRVNMGKRDTDSGFVSDVVKAQVEAFSPVPLDAGYKGMFGDTVGFVMQLMSNKDDLGRKIANTDEFSAYDEPLALTGDNSTPRAYHVMAKMMAKIGGGDLEGRRAPVGFLDASPEQLEAIANYIGGGLVSLANKGIRWWENMDSGNLQSSMDVISELPIASRLISTAKEQRAIAERYYAERGEFERHRDIVQDRIRAGMNPEEAIRLDDSVYTEGMEAARYKKGNKDRGKKKGDLRRTESGGAVLEPGDKTPAQSLRDAEKKVKALNKAIRGLRSPDATNEQAMNAMEVIVPTAIGLTPTYDPKEKLTSKVRTLAIQRLQDQRQEAQRALLQALDEARDEDGDE